MAGSGGTRTLKLKKKHGQCDYNQNDEPAAFNLNVYAQGVASR